MCKSIIKSSLVFFLSVLPTIGLAEETICTGKIQAVSSRAGVVLDNSPFITPLPNTNGNMLSIATDFGGGEDIILCSLNSSVDTDTNLDVDASNIDPSTIPSGFTPEDALNILRNASSIRVSGELCQQWFTASQLALALDLSISVTYPAKNISSCQELGGDNTAYPTSFRIAR